MERCKSAPGLLEASQAQPIFSKPIRKYGSLPDSLFKRIDASLINTATPSQRLKERRAAARAAADKKLQLELQEQLLQEQFEQHQQQLHLLPHSTLSITEEPDELGATTNERRPSSLSSTTRRRHKNLDNSGFKFDSPCSSGDSGNQQQIVVSNNSRSNNNIVNSNLNNIEPVSPVMSQIMEEFLNLKENFNGTTNGTDEVLPTPTSISINSFNFSVNNNTNQESTRFYNNNNNNNNATFLHRASNSSATQRALALGSPITSSANMDESIIIRNGSSILVDDFRVLNELEQQTRRSFTTVANSPAGNNNPISSNVNTVLIDELNRLRKYAYYLERENLKLNLKIDRFAVATTAKSGAIASPDRSRRGGGAGGQTSLSSSSAAALNPFELELSVRKAVPESDSDEYKV
jgi:hypothetical protein